MKPKKKQRLEELEASRLRQKIAAAPLPTAELVQYYDQLNPLSCGLLRRALEQALAKRADTPKAILDELYKSKDHALLNQLAQNPSITTNQLVWLSRNFSRSAIHNPLLPLLLLEDPSLSLFLDEDLQALSEVKGAVARFWSAFVLRPGVLLVLARDKTQPPEVLQGIIESGAVEATLRVISHPNVTTAQLTQLAEHPAVEVRSVLAKADHTPLPLLYRLSKDAEPEVRAEVAANTKAPSALLQALVRDPSPEVVRTALRNPKTPSLSILALYEEARPELPGLYFAEAPQATSALLVSLLQRPEPPIAALAEHPNTPTEVLHLILQQHYDRESPVRILGSLGSHANATPELLWTLSGMGSFARRAIAQNPRAPRALLQQLVSDEHSEVSESARKTLIQLKE